MESRKKHPEKLNPDPEDLLAICSYGFDVWTHKEETIIRQTIILHEKDDFYEAQKIMSRALDDIEQLAKKREMGTH